MELIAAGPRRGVEDAAAGAAHLRVVGVHLHAHVLEHLAAGIGGRAVLQVGDREPVEQVVVRSHPPAAHRQRRGAALILHAVPVGVAAALHRRHRDRHQEDVAADARQRFERLRVEHVGMRGVGRLDQRRIRRDRDRLFEGADLERDVQRQECLRRDADARRSKVLNPVTLALTV